MAEQGLEALRRREAFLEAKGLSRREVPMLIANGQVRAAFRCEIALRDSTSELLSSRRATRHSTLTVMLGRIDANALAQSMRTRADVCFQW